MILSETAKRAIIAYGGFEIWQNNTFIEAEVSVKGLAFTLKQRCFFERVNIEMKINTPNSSITPIGKDKNIIGILEGNNVRLEDADRNIVSERLNPRDYFPYGRRLLYWDDLDMAYFANYAFWNYLTLPKLLMNETIEWTEKREGVLEAKFPETIPTHSRIQEFHFDTITGLLLQHNYTADIISKYAKAAHVIVNHITIDELTFPSIRLVTPRTKRGGALKKPILIDIIVHNLKLTNAINSKL